MNEYGKLARVLYFLAYGTVLTWPKYISACYRLAVYQVSLLVNMEHELVVSNQLPTPQDKLIDQ